MKFVSDTLWSYRYIPKVRGNILKCLEAGDHSYISVSFRPHRIITILLCLLENFSIPQMILHCTQHYKPILEKLLSMILIFLVYIFITIRVLVHFVMVSELNF